MLWVSQKYITELASHSATSLSEKGMNYKPSDIPPSLKECTQEVRIDFRRSQSSRSVLAEGIISGNELDEACHGWVLVDG